MGDLSNMTNAEGIVGQIGGIKKITEESDELLDNKDQIIEDCKILDAELNYYIEKVINKAKIRYSLKSDVETYNQLIHLEQSIKTINYG